MTDISPIQERRLPICLVASVVGVLFLSSVACERDAGHGRSGDVHSNYHSLFELLLRGKTREFIARSSWDVIVQEEIPGMPLYAVSATYLTPQDLTALLDKYPQLRDHRSSNGKGLLHYYCQDINIVTNKASILMLLNFGFDWRARSRAGEDASDCLRSAYERSVEQFRRGPKTLEDGSQDVPGYSEKDLQDIYDEIMRAMNSQRKDAE